MKERFIFVFVTIFLLFGCSLNINNAYNYTNNSLTVAIDNGDCSNPDFIIDNDNNSYAELNINGIGTIYIKSDTNKLNIKLEADNNINYIIRATLRDGKTMPLDYNLDNGNGFNIYSDYETDKIMNGFYINISSKENTNIKVYNFKNY